MSATTSQDTTQPIPVALGSTLAWAAGMVVIGLLVLYFIGVDQGATSVFGNDTHIHEFVHDARHFLGFPCH